MKHLTTIRFVVVPCPPVVEVLIRRPDIKYQLGFSVQNGIVSDYEETLLRKESICC